MRTEAEQRSIREDIFRWLEERLAAGSYELSRPELESYRYLGERIPLLDRSRGIRNPVDFDATLSIMTGAKGNSYADEIRPDGLVKYSYQSREGGDNIKLRRAYENGDPLVYFHGIRPGYYVAYYPVYIVQDDPATRTVYVALDESLRLFGDPLHMTADQRRYAERIVQERLHQPMFRARVLRAYSSTCAVCSLKHPELLDAAHIIGDTQLRGVPQVTNGLALCKIHYASYDRNLLGITPNYQVRINRELLDEIDGPMLRHGLQDMHGRTLVLPHRKAEWPSADRLAERFAEFVAA